MYLDFDFKAIDFDFDFKAFDLDKWYLIILRAHKSQLRLSELQSNARRSESPEREMHKGFIKTWAYDEDNTETSTAEFCISQTREDKWWKFASFFFTHGREDGGQILKQAQASSLKIVPKLVYLFLIQFLFV